MLPGQIGLTLKIAGKKIISTPQLDSLFISKELAHGAVTRFEELAEPDNASTVELQNDGADTTPHFVWKSAVNGRSIHSPIEP
jgi:hypothetical protein